MLKINGPKERLSFTFSFEMPLKSWEEYKKRVYKIIIPTSLYVLKKSQSSVFQNSLIISINCFTSDTNAEVTSTEVPDSLGLARGSGPKQWAYFIGT